MFQGETEFLVQSYDLVIYKDTSYCVGAAP